MADLVLNTDISLDADRCALIIQDLQNDVIIEGGAFAPGTSRLKVRALCTNRDLVLRTPWSMKLPSRRENGSNPCRTFRFPFQRSTVKRLKLSRAVAPIFAF